MPASVSSFLTVAAFAAVAVSQPAAAKKEAPVAAEYGPQPDWGHYKEVAEAAVRVKLIDPGSAQFDWPYGYVQRGYTPFMSKRVYGYATCGFVNSRNRMGGYAGRRAFVVVIDFDQVRYVEVSTSLNGGGLLEQACQKAGFPVAPAASSPAISTSLPQGFDISPVPDGAYVGTVTPGSLAAGAGLKPGMVIARVNGIAIKGIEIGSIRQMIAGADGPLKVEMIGGATLTLAASR